MDSWVASNELIGHLPSFRTYSVIQSQQQVKPEFLIKAGSLTLLPQSGHFPGCSICPSSKGALTAFYDPPLAALFFWLKYQDSTLWLISSTSSPGCFSREYIGYLVLDLLLLSLFSWQDSWVLLTLQRMLKSLLSLKNRYLNLRMVWDIPSKRYRQGQTILNRFFNILCLLRPSSSISSLQQTSTFLHRQGMTVHSKAFLSATYLVCLGERSKEQKCQAYSALFFSRKYRSLRKSRIAVTYRQQYLKGVSRGCEFSRAFRKQLMPSRMYYCRIYTYMYSKKCSLFYAIMLYMLGDELLYSYDVCSCRVVYTPKDPAKPSNNQVIQLDHFQRWQIATLWSTQSGWQDSTLSK